MGENTLSCKCLNVAFELTDLTDGNPLDSHSEMNYGEIISLLNSPRQILPDKCCETCVKMMMPSLVNAQQVRDWKLFTCFNCKTSTHAVSSHNNPKVLVNAGELLDGKEQGTVIMQNPKCYQLFKVMSGPVKEPMPKRTSLKPSLLESVRELKTRASQFLRSEKEAMEQRIREFEISQRALYEEMEGSILESRENLEHQIWAAYNESNEDNDSAYERSVEEISSVSSATTSFKDKTARSSSLVDDMFELDPFGGDMDDGDLDDDIFSDDDSAVPNYQSRNREDGDSTQIAKSVPVAIPNMRQSVGHMSGDSDDDTPDPQQMQASMRALAQSVGGDGTQIFGDLPRPRFNTYSRRSHNDY